MSKIQRELTPRDKHHTCNRGRNNRDLNRPRDLKIGTIKSIRQAAPVKQNVFS